MHYERRSIVDLLVGVQIPSMEKWENVFLFVGVHLIKME